MCAQALFRVLKLLCGRLEGDQQLTRLALPLLAPALIEGGPTADAAVLAHAASLLAALAVSAARSDDG